MVLEDNSAGGSNPKACISIAVAILFLIAVPGTVITPFAEEEVELSSYESFQLLKEEQTGTDSPLSRDRITSQTRGEGYPTAPFPRIHDDGRPEDEGPSPKPQGGNPLMEGLSQPPYNTGGGYSWTTDSLGEYQVGATNEYWIGDQNGNGRIEWVVYYFYRPNSVNGLDDDGDGCVDELTHGFTTGQIGCDNIPDAMVYFETGFLAIPGGSNGDMILVVDYFGQYPSLKLFKIGVTPRWQAYALRGVYLSPHFVGDFIPYYSMESLNGVNANPEMDNDRLDYYVGSIDVRGFPARTPTDRACSAGMRSYFGSSFQREDGWIVVSYELWESFDDQDWNGDGDKADYVASYYTINPLTGDCRIGVNGGVYGWFPMNSGTVLITGYTLESGDSRDWNGDGDMFDMVSLWHDINSTWNMRGRIYRSQTYQPSFISLLARKRFGFGFWGNTVSYVSYQHYPLKFGGAYYKYMGYPQYYKTFYWLSADEDGDPHTLLPSYEVAYGQPAGTYGGKCIHIYASEFYMQRAGVRLIGNKADCNGDGDYYDFWCQGVFCPYETGLGGVWVTEANVSGVHHPYGLPGRHVKFRCADYVVEDSEGRVAIPFFVTEIESGMDLDGDAILSNNYIHLSYLFRIPN